MARAEIISIGDELTSGQRLDTNSKWLSERLGDLGIKTAFHTTVGDSLDDNVDAFRTAVRRADLVLVTGGLGPTADDLTREAIATAFDAPLELRSEALEHIENLFSKRKRPMPERNRVQAMFPEGARIIPNPHGTAPGIDFSIAPNSGSEREAIASGSRIFALPGVPAEMMQMFRETVEGIVTQEMGLGKRRWFYHCIKVFGIGESDVEKRLPDLIQRDRDPLVGITVSKATITLRIAALCENDSEFRVKIEPTVKMIRQELGLLIFGEGEIDLQDAVHGLLLGGQKSLGILEIGSSMRIEKWFADRSPQDGSGLKVAQWLPSLDSLPKEWVKGTPNFESTEDVSISDVASRLAAAAESLRMQWDVDLWLAAGVYPTFASVISSTTLPSADFTFALARRGKSTKCTTVSLGAHPEVLYHRVAKTGLNFLRMELMQRG
jgi:nicotinamide-nucleotide amidase